MGKAGKALKQVLEQYEITQNQLAVVMGISRSNIHRWVYEIGDPVGDSILEIRNALHQIDPNAAETFTKLYWNDAAERD